LAVFEEAAEFHPQWVEIKAGAHLPPAVAENDYFWLLALTPSRIEKPSAPELNISFQGGVRLIIRAALTGPPETLGGYQMATGRSRPNRSFVPAGSSWLFRLEGGDEKTRAQALRQLHDKHVLGPAHEACFGFGHTLVGLGPLKGGESI
jgi:CRISPR-associated protein Cmr3